MGGRGGRRQRRGKARTPAVPAHGGHSWRRTSPAPWEPHGGGSGRPFYFRREGNDVLVSPSEHVASGPEDARPFPGDVERLIARLNTLTTLGISAVRTAWTGLRTEAADGVPVVGFDAEATGFYWLAGQGGYGFQTSSAIAELAAAQILTGQNGTGTGHQSGIPDSGGAGRDALVHPALKNGSMTTLITNLGELMTQDQDHRVLRNAAVVIEGERIAWLGAAADAPAADESVDAGGRALLPGWVDSHTHLVFAGDRTAEFEARMAGESYSAGGIAVTTGATRSTGDYDLTRLAMGRVAEAVSQGTTYVETKTGYGLDVEQEARSARIASTVADEVTYLGAHLVPADMDADEYTDLVCGPMLDAVRPYVTWADVFCERGAFTEEQSRRVLQACRDAGLGLRVHGNQLGPGAGVRLAVEFGAASVDHVNYLSDEDVEALAASWSGWSAGAGRVVAAPWPPACRRVTFPPGSPGARPPAPGCRRASGPGLQLQSRDVVHELHGILCHHCSAADAAERSRSGPRGDVRRGPCAGAGVRDRRRRRTRGGLDRHRAPG